MTTDNPIHGFWGWLRLKATHPARKSTTTTKTDKGNSKPGKTRPGRRIMFLEMP